MKYHVFIYLVLISFASVGCGETLTFEEQLVVDHQVIEDYISSNNLDGTFLNDGLFIVTEVEGTGEETPSLSDSISIDYTGYLLDGTVFDSSGGTPRNFALNRLIQGWQLGLQEFKKGGEGILLIASGYAYGVSGAGPIPPNAVLRFDIALKDFAW